MNEETTIQRTDRGVVIMMPRAPGSDTPPVRMNLTRIYETLGRVEEIASLTPVKALELMSAFNKAYLDLGKYEKLVLLEKSKAKGALDEVKAIIILDKAPGILATKQIRESDVTRQAVCDLDPEYKLARETFDRLCALHETLKHHMKVLENSYTGAKKLIGEKNPNLIDQRALLDGVIDENKHTGDEQSPFFGTPRIPR